MTLPPTKSDGIRMIEMAAFEEGGHLRRELGHADDYP
jgi:hypothetical protein